MEAIDGQLSFFNEADAIYDDTAAEPTAEEALPPRPRRKKTKGRRETDLKEFPEEVLAPYSISEEELDAFYSKGNWKRMPDETYKRPVSQQMKQMPEFGFRLAVADLSAWKHLS